MMGDGGVKNYVTSFMDDPLVHYVEIKVSANLGANFFAFSRSQLLQQL